MEKKGYRPRIAQWAFTYQRKDFRHDVIAGFTVGSMLAPQAMAYALLAGLPPETGLYASILPALAYALFGSSRQLAVGPVAIMSLLTASAVGTVAQEGESSYAEAAALLALMIGAFHILMAIGRLDFLTRFLSHSVLVGFVAGAAIITGLSQTSHLLGIRTARKSRLLDMGGELIRHLSEMHFLTFLIGVLAIAGLILLKKRAPHLPGALIVTAASTALIGVAKLEEQGVRTVGNMPEGFPSFSLPTFHTGLMADLLPSAIIITLISFMESSAISNVFARRHGYQVHQTQELTGLGAANLVSGIVGGFPVSGGFARSAVTDDAGARTLGSSLVSAAVVTAVLLFFTSLLAPLPNAALSAIVIVSVSKLVDIKELRHIAKIDSKDFATALIALFTTLFLGVELGLLIGVIIGFFRRSPGVQVPEHSPATPDTALASPHPQNPGNPTEPVPSTAAAPQQNPQQTSQPVAH